MMEKIKQPLNVLGFTSTSSTASCTAYFCRPTSAPVLCLSSRPICKAVCHTVVFVLIGLIWKYSCNAPKEKTNGSVYGRWQIVTQRVCGAEGWSLLCPCHGGIGVVLFKYGACYTGLISR